MPLRFLTAGESHGPRLTVIVDGLPAGLAVDSARLARELRRRQGGYGRGGRMKIEKDTARITGGVRHGRTLGGPVSLDIENLDFANWSDAMSPEAPATPPGAGDSRAVTKPRPGHADLPGALKFGEHDVRNILERASARETASRVAAGTLARLLLERLGMEVLSHTIAVGPVSLPEGRTVSWEEIRAIPDDSPLRCVDVQAESAMKAAIDQARDARDSLGGAFQVVVRGVPPGLGSFRQWDTKIDGKIARAVMSIHAVKAVEIGDGIRAAGLKGSEVHDEIHYDAGDKRFHRETNRAGGLEGGITNGEELRVTGYMKPLSTLPTPLKTVDLKTKRPEEAVVERTDTCAVTAAGVIGESMVALVLADACLEKFGGDSMVETERNKAAFMKQVGEF